MITIADFRTRYPEYSDDTLFPDARIQMFIDDAVVWMSESTRWLDWYDLAQFCLVAHFLAVATITESGDATSMFPIALQEVDDVIIKSAVSDINPTMDNFHTTAYGQCYYRYLRMTFAGIYGV